MERFEEAWEEDRNGCWIWKMAPVGKYGQWYLDKKFMLAHRAAWILYRGPIPRNVLVLHSCDVPLCVNPNHLRLGTYRDNAHDAISRGRFVRGEKHGMSKLTAADVLAIRASSEPCSVLIDRYGIVQSAISAIKLRKSWSHIE
jgi:hypothetical protein